MGARGTIRDALMIYIGLKLIFNEDLILYGSLMLIFPIWFFLERIGILKQ